MGDATKQTTKRLANSAMERASHLVEELQSALEVPNTRITGSVPLTVDITKELGFSKEATEVYEIVMNAIGEYFLHYPGFFEELVQKIHLELRQRIPQKAH